MWHVFLDKVTSLTALRIPKSQNSSKKRFPKWMTRAAKRAGKCKSSTWKRYKASKSYNDYVEYKRALNRSTSEYRESKK